MEDEDWDIPAGMIPPELSLQLFDFAVSGLRRCSVVVTTPGQVHMPMYKYSGLPVQQEAQNNNRRLPARNAIVVARIIRLPDCDSCYTHGKRFPVSNRAQHSRRGTHQVYPCHPCTVAKQITFISASWRTLVKATSIVESSIEEAHVINHRRRHHCDAEATKEASSPRRVLNGVSNTARMQTRARTIPPP